MTFRQNLVIACIAAAAAILAALISNSDRLFPTATEAGPAQPAPSGAGPQTQTGSTGSVQIGAGATGNTVITGDGE